VLKINPNTVFVCFEHCTDSRKNYTKKNTFVLLKNFFFGMSDLLFQSMLALERSRREMEKRSNPRATEPKAEVGLSAYQYLSALLQTLFPSVKIIESCQ